MAAGGRNLGRSTGPILGNFRSPNGPVITSIHSYAYGDPFFETDAFYLMSWSADGWCGYSNGFYSYMSYQCRTANLADLNGDGLRDVCATLLDTRWGQSNVWSWQIRQNIGNDSADLYSYSGNRIYLDTLFLTNPDTTFSAPEIGDITGDGRAELAVFAQPTDGEREILFYEFSGTVLQPVFTQRPEWSNGLPTGLLSFHLADLDADSLCELIVKTEGGSNWGHWEIYFRRHGQWALYENILPEFTPTTIYFADLEGDGDLDLFTPGQVWISLNPDAISEPFIPHPSSLILSSYPNPFNAQTTITFTLPSAGRVRLELFDVLGRSARLLLDEPRMAGEHFFRLDASDLPTGIYFARLAGREPHTIKLMLLK
ncbi:T9SS type A sorting domain-containing protein [bacterium]|nr:T9SS type A sorting domain-containing protein [bacterium]